MPASQLDSLILRALAHAAVPLSAYEIIYDLREDRKTVAATPVYRALKRLLDRGEIERVETLSAYRVRTIEKCIHCICQSCHKIETIPLPKAVDTLDAAVRSAGFLPQRFIVEVAGYCAHCKMTRQDSAN